MSKVRKPLDRRIIFLLVFIGVALPIMIKVGLPIETTENVEMVYDLVESTPEGSHILISFDYDPSTKPEIHPQAIAVIKHALKKKQKIICMALWPMGVKMCEQIFETLAEEGIKPVYGTDWVNMGYKSGGAISLKAIGADFRKVFTQDTNGTLADDIPALKSVRSLQDFEYVMSFSAGVPGIKEWVQVGHDMYKTPVSGGVTAVSAPSILPYVNEQKQLTGLLGGMKAAAEYEKLIGIPGTATKGMDAQSFAHLIIIILIIIGNVNYFHNKKIMAEEEAQK
ncbi:MAG: hypothetical protein RAO94_09260 [Candidatus Stygibacter australis]|nr:hypothetical protein [Candidatus Stygibacter australis]MDP8322525.1 hypothetical protein [Candidatus Stygibacter australis]